MPMDFLVEIEIAPLPDRRAEEIRAAEQRRGEELMASGTLREIWRIPGRTANVGIWSASDATDLHAAITSLPAFEWMDVRVTALAEHPLGAAVPRRATGRTEGQL
jgi:muconolactone D-isomerase